MSWNWVKEIKFKPNQNRYRTEGKSADGGAKTCFGIDSNPNRTVPMRGDVSRGNKARLSGLFNPGRVRLSGSLGGVSCTVDSDSLG